MLCYVSANNREIRILNVRSREMKRTYLILTSVLLLCVSAYALKTGAFRSLDHLSKAENLLIIQVPISYHTSPPSYEMEEPTMAYNVKVLKDEAFRIKMP